MEKQPQFPFAPKDFARCLNATCPRSQNCLRRTAALQDTDEHLFLKVVNPLRYPKEGEECELFRSTDKVRMAWGVTHLLDNVPYKEGSLLRNMIINHLGRSQYYRCFRKERPFAPQDQQTIRMLFVTRNFAASLFRNIKYFTLRKLYLCRKWMQKRLQKTTTTGITLPNFDFLA